MVGGAAPITDHGPILGENDGPPSDSVYLCEVLVDCEDDVLVLVVVVVVVVARMEVDVRKAGSELNARGPRRATGVARVRDTGTTGKN